MKKVISKNTIKVGNKHYTEEKYWARLPSDRIITTRTRKLTMEDFFNVGEFILILLAGFLLLKILFDFFYWNASFVRIRYTIKRLLK